MFPEVGWLDCNIGRNGPVNLSPDFGLIAMHMMARASWNAKKKLKALRACPKHRKLT
jgi:hypothetical protein